MPASVVRTISLLTTGKAGEAPVAGPNPNAVVGPRISATSTTEAEKASAMAPS